jgi:hypothetical protein
MSESDPDLLGLERGLVVAPAGCGKTELIARTVARHHGSKPIAILTHTNAGVAALRSRLDRAGVVRSKYHLGTIDGWAVRLISTFPERAGHDPEIMTRQRPSYPAVREAAARLIEAGHVDDVIRASYSHLLVDEYQDCSIRQHEIVYHAARCIPTCVVADPMQAIFGFGDDPLADWVEHVEGFFPLVATLNKPWRWINSGTEALGEWLLDVRRALLAGEHIDVSSAPEEVAWVHLDGRDDRAKLRDAGRVAPPGKGDKVVIIGNSKNPNSQRLFAMQTPGAVTVEAVDFRDLISFARSLDLLSPGALRSVAEFAESVMTNVGASDLVRRVASLERGSARRAPSDVERAALLFQRERTAARAADLLIEINGDSGVRAYRPDVLRACVRALRMSGNGAGMTFAESALRVREEGRIVGRWLPRRAVGSTLLLKGLEAEVVVILDGDGLDARNLYVALTRGSKRVVVCSRSPALGS